MGKARKELKKPKSRSSSLKNMRRIKKNEEVLNKLKKEKV